MSETYDKETNLKICKEELEQAKFIKNKLGRVALRMGTDEGAPIQVAEGLSLPEFDKVLGTYPNTTTEVFTYSLAASDVAVVTVVYSNAAKTTLVSLIKTVP